MNSYSRRSVLRNLSVAGTVATSGCSTIVSDFSERSVQYVLDAVFVENVHTSPVTFGLKIYDGDEVLFDEDIELEAMKDGKTDYQTIEKPWMNENGRYGVEIRTPEGETISLSLSDVLDQWNNSVHKYEFMEYAIFHQSDSTFGIYPDFFDKSRTE